MWRMYLSKEAIMLYYVGMSAFLKTSQSVCVFDTDDMTVEKCVLRDIIKSGIYVEGIEKIDRGVMCSPDRYLEYVNKGVCFGNKIYKKETRCSSEIGCYYIEGNFKYNITAIECGMLHGILCCNGESVGSVQISTAIAPTENGLILVESASDKEPRLLELENGIEVDFNEERRRLLLG